MCLRVGRMGPIKFPFAVRTRMDETVYGCGRQGDRFAWCERARY